jgi:hypothetical protein
MVRLEHEHQATKILPLFSWEISACAEKWPGCLSGSLALLAGALAPTGNSGTIVPELPK